MKKRAAKPILITLFIIGSILCTATPSFSQTPSKQTDRGAIAEKINAIIDKEVQKTDLTGATIAVYYKGAPLITRGIGYADEPNQIKVNEHTGFHIGSITKLFTAMSAMKLVEEGVLSLDDSIFKYLPDYQPKLLPGVKKDNRIRDLLTHHNGIPSLWLKDNFLKAPSLEPLRQLPKALSDDYLVEDRREVHAYSNAAYALAGLIVERASGQPYDEFIKELFFETLEMKDAHAFLPEDRKNIALPHYGHQSEKLLESYCIPAGSIITSSADMQRFMKMIFETWDGEEDDVIGPTTLRQMTKYQHHNVKYDNTNFMGLGFFIEQSQGVFKIEHNGGTETFYSELQLLPDLGIGVFISTNGYESASFSGMTTNNILNALIGKDNNRKGKEKQIKLLPQSKKNIVAPSGKYVFGSDYIVTIDHNSQSPFIILDGIKSSLEPFEKNGWKIIDFPRATLHKSARHEGYYLKYGSYSINLMALKKYPSSTHWDRLKGRIYTSQCFSLGKIYLKLEYIKPEQVYYTSMSIPDLSIDWNFFQHIISDTLLQVQGRGRSSSLVTQFIGEDTVKFAGLTFTLEKNSDHKRIADLSITQPSNREEVIRRIKSLFSPHHRGTF